VLRCYTWPGNVRELRNLIERIVILTPESEENQPASAATLLNHLNDETLSTRFASVTSSVSGDASASAAKNLKDARTEFEKDFIIQTLEQNDWNISKTAQILGIERSHLHRKIKSYGIEEKEGS
jgi:two-component system nitrogen regulation response regulator NtrX